MRIALTWFALGFLLVAWGLTVARDLHWLPAAAFTLDRIAGDAVLGGVPFFVAALVVALWPDDRAHPGAPAAPPLPHDAHDPHHQAAD